MPVSSIVIADCGVLPDKDGGEPSRDSHSSGSDSDDDKSSKKKKAEKKEKKRLTF